MIGRLTKLAVLTSLCFGFLATGQVKPVAALGVGVPNPFTDNSDPTKGAPSYIYGLDPATCNGGLKLTFPYKGLDMTDNQEYTFHCLRLSGDESTYVEIPVAQNHACDRTDVVEEGVAMPIGFSVTRNNVQTCYYFQQDKVKATRTINSGTGGDDDTTTHKDLKTSTIPSQLGSADQLGVPKVNADQSSVGSALSAVFLILGGLAVVIIVWAGIQYVTSAGNPEQTRKAKDTILYAVIGLIVALLAFTIVSFVTGRFG